jgi:hypothetical protein
MGAVGKQVLATRSLSTPLLDDVSLPFVLDHDFFFTRETPSS